MGRIEATRAEIWVHFLHLLIVGDDSYHAKISCIPGPNKDFEIIQEALNNGNSDVV